MKINIKDVEEQEMMWKEVASTHFNIYYNKARSLEKIVLNFISLYGEKEEKEIRSIITNTARMLKIKAKYIKIPRGKTVYHHNPQEISYTRMMRLLDKMEVDGYVNLYIGGVKKYIHSQAEEFETSLTEITDKFIALFDTIDLFKVLSNKVDVELEIKERGTKKIMNTQGVTGVTAMKNTIELFNTALIESRISLKGIDLPDQNYKRVFINNLTTGGRWYNVIGGIQTMESSLQPFLQIDGEELSSLDFSAMHANVCYEQIAAELPKGFDPYGVDLWEFNVDPSAVESFKMRHGRFKYDPARNLVKMAVMIGLNAKDMKEARNALSQKFGQDQSLWGTANEHKAKYFGLYEIDFKDVLKKVCAHNSLISDRFFQDCGVNLQFIDSEIMEKVICDTLAIDEVLLPWHDGLMVKRSIKDQVKQFMVNAWYKQLGSINFCKVEEK